MDTSLRSCHTFASTSCDLKEEEAKSAGMAAFLCSSRKQLKCPLNALIALGKLPYGTAARQPRLIYLAPLATTAKRLKRFSVGSLFVTIGALPFIFTLEAQVPFSMRLALAGSGI